MQYISPKISKSPMATCFVITYNHENYISDAIEGILSQKVSFPFEIVIVDDCSTDKTIARCLEYYEKYPELITVIVNDSNKGLIRNYHESIDKYCRGKYIAQCAGDDWWIDEYKLQKQVEFLEKNTEYDLIYSKAKIYMQNQSKYLRETNGYECCKFEKMIVNYGVPALTICFSKQAFCEYVNEIEPCMRFSIEDYPMLVWFSYRKNIHFMDEVTAVYRVHNNSITGKRQVRSMDYYLLEKKGLEIKKFFIDIFNIKDEKLLDSVFIHYYSCTMYLASLFRDITVVKERNRLFLKNKMYIEYIISRIYGLFGQNKKCNTVIHFFESRLRKMIHKKF